MTDAPKPILVFDSGIGGLTVLRELRVLMPERNFVYVADDAGFPYGNWAEPELRVRIVVPPAVQQPVRLLEAEQVLRQRDPLDAVRAARLHVPFDALDRDRRTFSVWLQVHVAVGQHHQPGGRYGESGWRFRYTYCR